jgi:sulfur dioxygenase
MITSLYLESLIACRGNSVSTIGQEKQNNPRLKLGTTKEQFIKIMENLNLPLPKSIQDVLQPNQSGYDPDRVKFPTYSDLCKVMQLSTEEVKEMMKNESPVLVDVREKEEFASLPPLKNSIHIPLGQLVERAKELVQYNGRPIVFVCRVGARSNSAAAIVNGMNLGLERVYNMKGGMLKWYEMERNS